MTSTSREFAATYPPPSRMAHNMVTDAGARSNPRLNVRVTQKALHTTHIATRCYQGHANCKLHAWHGRSLAHSNEALKRCCESIAPRATPGLLHRELLPVNSPRATPGPVCCTESYSWSAASRLYCQPGPLWLAEAEAGTLSLLPLPPRCAFWLCQNAGSGAWLTTLPAL